MTAIHNSNILCETTAPASQPDHPPDHRHRPEPQAKRQREAVLRILSQRFPLLPRPKPPCGSLAARLDRLRQKAAAAGEHDDNALLHAAEALNLAALIASDCAMPTLARDLCWRQIYLFATGPGPYEPATAKLALQPLINLARLHARDGNPNTAYHLHEALLRAARSRGDLHIDGHLVPLSTLIADSDHHAEIIQWLWTVLLSSGLHALCAAGRWSDAHQHAAHHNGIGQRLLDGRQIAIIDHAITGRHADAEDLLDGSETAEEWEHGIATSIRVLTRILAGHNVERLAATMTAAYLALNPDPRTTTFRLRLGLTVADLVHTSHQTPPPIALEEQLLDDACHDAYLARDLLAAQSHVSLPTAVRRQAHDAVHRASLGTPLPAADLATLMKAVRRSETALATQLQRP